MKKLLWCVLLLSSVSWAAAPVVDSVEETTDTLLNAVTSTGAGSAIAVTAIIKSFQASGTTTAGSGAATVLAQGSNDGTNWMTLCTITLTLAVTTSSDGCVSQSSWRYFRGNASALSGTGAAVTLTVRR